MYFFNNELFFFQLGNLERKWCHLEQNNFVMKECMCCFCNFLMITLFIYNHTFLMLEFQRDPLFVSVKLSLGSESIAHEAEGWMGYLLRSHEGERNNCCSKIQVVAQKNIEAKHLFAVKAGL